jgi:Ca2+-binding RTX toxin-like protein
MAKFSIAAYDNSAESTATRAQLLAEASWDVPALSLPTTGVTPGGDTFTFVDGYFIGRGGITGTDFGSAFVARCGDTLVLSFEGTDSFLVDLVINDVLGMSTALTALRPLIDAINDYTAHPGNGISQVYVTGHSLGGGLAQAFMMSHADSTTLSYRAITFAAPGYNSNLLDELVQLFGKAPAFDDRITHLEAGFDAVPDLLLKTGRTLHFYNAESAGNILFWQLHGKDRYLELARFLDAEGLTPADVPDADANLLASVLGSTAVGWFPGDGDNLVQDHYGLYDFDTMLGGQGNDTLGQADFGDDSGINVLIGGAGNDVYHVDDLQDRIIERAGGGLDRVESVVSYVLPDHVEELRLLSNSPFSWFDADIDGTGNALANRIAGNDDDNVLTGLAGNDTLIGGAGADQLLGGSGDDWLVARGGSDRLLGGLDNDIYDVMRVDYNPPISINVPTYTLYDEGGGLDVLWLRDDFQADLDGLEDLMFRAVGYDLWIDIDVDLFLDDDDDGRIIIQDQGQPGHAIETLVLFDELGVESAARFSLSSAFTSLLATGSSDWYRMLPGSSDGLGLALTPDMASVQSGESGGAVPGANVSLSLGTTFTASGQLVDVGYSTVYSVVPAQSGGINIDLTVGNSAEGAYRVEVLDPIGFVLESWATDSWNNNFYRVGVASTGAHSVRLINVLDEKSSDLDLNNGRYTLSLSQAPTEWDYESEGNNIRAGADALTLGRLTEGQLSTYNGDTDWYKVTPSQVGALSILLDTGWSSNMTVQVSDASGQVLESFKTADGDRSTRFHVGVANTGTHYIKVFHAPADGALNTARYDLTVTQAPTDWDYESEPNATRATADIVVLGRTNEGQLSTPLDVDWYEVVPSQAGALEIVLDDDAWYSNLSLQLTDGSGQVLETFKALDNSRNTDTFFVGVASTAAHYLKVYHDPADGAHSAGLYTLNISQADTAIDYESEFNNGHAVADSITLGRTLQGQLSKPADVDWYKLTPSQAGGLQIVLDDDAWYSNLSLQLTDDSGQVLETFKAPDNSRSTDTFFVGVASTAAHYLKVYHDPADGAHSAGLYTLKISQADTTIDYESEPNNTREAADALTLDRWALGQLSTAGDTDWYRVVPSTPGTLTLSVDPQQYDSNLSVQVADALGQVLQTFVLGDSNGTHTFSLPIDRVDAHHLRVFYDPATGAHNPGLYELKAATTNLVPVLAAPVADLSITEDAAWSLNLPAGTFSDPGDALAWTATLANDSPLPAWLSFDPDTRTFSGTPDNAQVGAWDLKVRVRDGSSATAADTFRLTVTNVNDAPRVVVALPDMAVNEDSGFSYTVPIGTFLDDDAGDSLTYTASLADAPTLPAWLSFNPASRSFSGTPANGDVGVIDVRVLARDRSGATQYDDFRLTVVNTQDAPLTAPAAVALTEDASHSFTVAQFPFLDVDSGAALAKVRITSLPATGTLTLGGVAFAALTEVPAADIAAGRLVYTPAANAVGAVTFGFAVSDGQSVSSSAVMTLTIAPVNDAPRVAAPLLDQVASTGKPFYYQVPQVAFADPDGDAIAYTATLSGGAPLPAWLIFDVPTRALSGTPGADAAGQWDVSVTATDPFGAATSDVVSIRVDLEHAASAAGATPAWPGTAVHSLVDSAGDKDWFSLLLNAATAYTISLDGAAVGARAAMPDPLLRLLDASGAQLQVSDDIGPGNVNSLIVFTPTTSGAYLVEAGGYGSNAGGYRLLVNTATPNLITGDAAANVLYGTAADDTLDGRGGADLMMGGDGSDLYVVDNAGDQVIESSAKTLVGGVDVIHSSLSTLTLPANVEQGVLVGAPAGAALTGNELDNRLTGDAGNNRLDGGAGTDTVVFSGQRAQYTITYDSTQDRFTVTDTVAGRDGSDLVQGVELFAFLDGVRTVDALMGPVPIDGTPGNDSLVGGPGDDTLRGSEGNDTLDGLGGNDTMIGGLGNDRYLVDAAGDVVSETSTDPAEIDTVVSAVNYSLGANLENLILSGSARSGSGNALANHLSGNDADNGLSGGGGNDTLLGGAGNDTLDGGPGSDSMVGGTGNDRYLVDSAGDVVVETSTVPTEIDIVVAGVSFGLSANVENLQLTGSALDGSGNALANNLTGNALANSLSGGGGNDTLNGLDGNDTLDGGPGIDRLVGGLGNDRYIVDSAGDVVVETSNSPTEIDTVVASSNFGIPANVENVILAGTARSVGGNALGNHITGNSVDNGLAGGGGNDTLLGGLGNDTLAGEAGNDVLEGGPGADRLNGGAGADQFRFVTTGDGPDTIVDFLSGTDKIVVVAANFGLIAGAAANLFVNTPASSGAAAFLYSSATGVFAFDADGNGAGAALTLATLANKPPTLLPVDVVLAP